MVAGRRIVRNYGRNNNSPATPCGHRAPKLRTGPDPGFQTVSHRPAIENFAQLLSGAAPYPSMLGVEVPEARWWPCFLWQMLGASLPLIVHFSAPVVSIYLCAPI